MVTIGAMGWTLWAATAQAQDPFSACTVEQAGLETRLACEGVELTVTEGGEADLTARLGAHLTSLSESARGHGTSERTAVAAGGEMLPAARIAWTERGAAAMTHSWLSTAAPAPLGSLLITCSVAVGDKEGSGRCDELVREVAVGGVPEAMRGFVAGEGADHLGVEAQVGLPLPGVLGCQTQARSSSVAHLCEDGVLAVALIPNPRSTGDVWQRQFLDGILGGLPKDQRAGSEDTVPCTLAGTETTCIRVHVSHDDGDRSWVYSGVSAGAKGHFTAVCAAPDHGFALPLYCRSVFGDTPPKPPPAEGKKKKRRK